MWSLKKSTISLFTRILGIFLALLTAFSIYQILNWNLFPWLKLSIISSSSLLCLIIGLVVKIQSPIIRILIRSMSFIQLLISCLFLSQYELLRTKCEWLFFPIIVIFSLFFWDLFSRKMNQIKSFGRIACFILLILTLLKFIISFHWLDYSLIFLVTVITLLLLFTKSKTSEES